jgi:uncharacterized protein (TIGR03118 family)
MFNWFTRPARTRRLSTPTFRPAVETLEDRRVPAGNVLQTNLVSDLPGVAQLQDANLVNPWGISESGGSPFWIANNNSGTSTLYNQNPGHTPPIPLAKVGLTVSMPTPDDPLGTSGTPTGTVFNIDGGTTGGFKVTGVTAPTPTSPSHPITAASAFLFATEDGTIIGWNPNVNPTGFVNPGTYGIIALNNAGNNFSESDPALQTGAVYKGMSIASGNGSPIIAAGPNSPGDPNSTFLLYVANFRSGKIEVYDPTFQPATGLSSTAFTDPSLPHGYAPFNVQILGNKVYVTYAKQNEDKHDDAAGPGRGFVDMYNLDGTGETRLVTRGDLNSPWGLAIAPSSFGSLAGALLVGNFGDGHIHAYNATNGTPMGTLTDPSGDPIQIDGLWALKVGNGGNGGDNQTVYFTAGLAHETHGLFGSLAPVAAGTPDGPAEEQAVQADLDVVALDLQAVISDVANHVPASTLRQDFKTLDTAIDDLVHAEITYFRDNHTFYQGSTAQGGATVQSIEALFAQLAHARGGDHDHDGDGDDRG